MLHLSAEIVYDPVLKQKLNVVFNSTSKHVCPMCGGTCSQTLHTLSKKEIKKSPLIVGKTTTSFICICGRYLKNLTIFSTHRRYCTVYKQTGFTAVIPSEVHKCPHCMQDFTDVMFLKMQTTSL
ncbi:hypothetical protein CDAR_175011 [Caerostris darwini]|uniref:Uncharacterized protein n=1 Tax=Caerostris darwini TaxID=1538125 RepID=A0AAV4W417_9ARAC|nr:hypothetical protein CDAR_175011 [Caerostris darwini]